MLCGRKQGHSTPNLRRSVPPILAALALFVLAAGASPHPQPIADKRASGSAFAGLCWAAGKHGSRAHRVRAKTRACRAQERPTEAWNAGPLDGYLRHFKVETAVQVARQQLGDRDKGW
jgi:hypothetical protein